MPATKPNASQKVLQYIDTLPAFSKAICQKLRSIILKADREIVEDWKWGPNYSLNGMVCGFGAFREHVKLTFFNGSAMKDAKKLFNHCVDNEFSRSVKYTDAGEIDEKAVQEYVRESIAVNNKGFKRVVKDKTVNVPADLQQALLTNKKAADFFDGLTYGYKKEFVEHVITAKRPETRLERIGKVVSLCADEKKLNDKYK